MSALEQGADGPLIDIRKYNAILLGYPLWHSYLPNIVINLLEHLNLEGKIIYPFNTYGTLGLGNSIEDIKNYAHGAIVKEGFPISDSMIKIKSESMIKIEQWINNNFTNPTNPSKSINSDEMNLNNAKIFKINFYLLSISAIFFI